MILTGAIIGGSVSSITKIGFVQIPPFSFSFIRFFIAGVVMIPFLPKKSFPRNHDFFKLMIISLLPVFNVIFYVSGLRLTTANVASVLYATTPILTGLFSIPLIDHKMPLKKWFSVLLGLFGVGLVILLPLIEKGTAFSGNLTGNLLITGGVILWALYLPLSTNLQKIYPPVLITFLFIAESAVIFFFLSLIEIKTLGVWWQNIRLSSIISVLYISIFATIGGYLLNQYSIKIRNPLSASLTHYLMPVFGYLFAFILLGERLTAGLLAGTILVFASIWLTLYKN